MEKAKLAILDMNNQEPNQGLRCIRDIVMTFGDKVDWKIFDVRAKNELPDLSYDIFICSGGPGSPLEGGEWKERFFHLIDAAWQHNSGDHPDKKYFFFICHSFQLACEHFGVCEIKPRKKTSFGVYPIHKTWAGKSDPLLDGLPDRYFAVDSRDWQLVQPRLEVFGEHGAQILSLEKIRTHVEYERALMAIRFSNEFVGTQFHPEADPIGMKAHFSQPEMSKKVIENYDLKKYEDMMAHLDDPDKIKLTYDIVIPGFISRALESIAQRDVVME